MWMNLDIPNPALYPKKRTYSLLNAQIAGLNGACAIPGAPKPELAGSNY